MKKLLVLFAVILFSMAVYAKTPEQKINKLPQGVFKKTWNGNIVHYDSNGKKTNTYVMKNGKIVRIK